MRIEGTVALVTGANRGVGRAYVEALHQRGAARIYAAGRDRVALEAVAALDPARIMPLVLDVTDPGMIERAAEKAKDVRLLINNAGALSFGGALEVSDAAIQRDMAVNYRGLRDVTKAFAPVISGNGGGAVVNMLTLLSFLSAPGFSAYNASKAAAWSMAMSLRAYLKQQGIDMVNAFPAGIDTEMLAGVDAPKDSPEVVAADVLNGLEAGAEDIYPASAQDVYSAWRADQKQVEGMFATMM